MVMSSFGSLTAHASHQADGTILPPDEALSHKKSVTLWLGDFPLK